MLKRPQNVVLGMALAVACFALAPAPADGAPVTVQVIVSIGPNPNSSPSFDAYASNAMTALLNGQTSAGTPGTPSYYSVVSSPQLQTNQIVATGFPSWQGVAPPGGAFSGEFGSFVYYSAHITSNGTPFSLHDVSVAFSSSDATVNAAISPFSDNWASNDYSQFRVGRLASNGSLVTSGDGGQQVTELWMLGAAIALQPPFGNQGGSDQDALNNFIAQQNALTDFTFAGNFSVSNRGSGGADPVVGPSNLVGPEAGVPEPTTGVLWSAAAVGLWAASRWRRARSRNPIPRADV
jgi:hypothetical protein